MRARQRSSQPGRRRPAPLIGLASVRRVVGAVADRFHASGDAEARAWGWEVTRTAWGGRAYRDPRVAQLAAQRNAHPTRLAARTGLHLAAVAVLAAGSPAGCQPPPTGTTSTGGGSAAGPGGIAGHIRACESGGNYRARNAHSTASGAYQFIDATWTGTTGLRPPASAYPPAMQDRAFYRLWANGRGAHNWNASRHCWGRYWTGR
jgi:hypothetical protein